MSQLYAAVRLTEQMIRDRNLDEFQVKGRINLDAGFFTATVTSDTPDDPEMLAALRSAAEKAIGTRMPF